MSGRRPDREPFEAIEVGIRRVRLLGLALLGLVVVLPGGHRPDTVGLGILAGLAALAVVADQLSRRLHPDGRLADRLVALQIGIDVVVTLGALVVIDPGAADGVWLLIALPVVEGALRHGLLGGAAVWLTSATAAAGWVVVGWNPGDGVASMIETGGLLAIALAVGLPAGLAADQLVDELWERRRERAEIARQAHLVSVLAVVGGDLATTDGPALCRALVEGAVELGFPGAELGIVAKDTGYHQLLASEPEGFATADPAGTAGGSAWFPSAQPGTSRLGPSGELIGVLAHGEKSLTVLTVGAEQDGAWEPRHQAFELLCRYGAISVTASARRHRIEEAGRQLDHRRTHDPLTGLLNRAGFVGAVATVLDGLAPGAEATIFAVDLDGFATVNVDNGWTTGDQVLTEVAARIRRTSPAGAALARLDGDQFAIVTDEPGATALAEHLKDILARPIATTQGAIVVRASVGQIITADPSYSPTAAVREAELRARATKDLSPHRVPHHAPHPAH